MKLSFRRLSSLCASSLLTLTTQAAVMVDFIEEGANVRVTVTGSIDVTGLTPSVAYGSATVASDTFIVGDGITAMIDPGTSPTIANAVATRRYTGANYVMSPLRPPAQTFDGRSMGANVAGLADLPLVCINSDDLIRDVLVSDALLTGGGGLGYYTTLLTGKSFADLDLINGASSTASWTSNSGPESVSFRVGSAVVPVPEPTTIALLLPALGLGLMRRRR